ncbi:choice-of-anchor I family protein [Flavobacterium soli]|uniref:choice-of-anchor I family protein n=1 Tax=Flavobacterium soli TaxID=344881 RepID=UPI00040189F0|nr:choice-of-anchor I family protein [Flavobacterium soli]
MFKNYKIKGFLFLLMVVMQTSSWGQSLVHYWNFNDNSTVVTLTTPSQTFVTGAGISAIAGGISSIDTAGGTGQNFDVDNLNARNSDVAGTHLRFNDPIGGQLQFDLPTTGFENVMIKFATRRSGSGAGEQLWSYSVDGTTYVPFVTILPISGNPVLETLDFSAIEAVNNNPNFKLRVAFQQGTGGTVGNNRFDNFTLEGNVVSVPALIHYWNFNDNSSVANLTTISESVVTGAGITAIAGGISAIDAAGGTGQNFDVDNLNARNSDVAGAHLRFNDPIGGQLQFDLPTTGFENVMIKFATRRSGSGAGEQLWSYSVDGTTYVPFATILPISGNPVLETLDFSAIEAVNNNPNFKLRVAFQQGTGGTVGNNRFDNLTVDGTSIGGGDAIAPVVTFSPSNNATNIAITSNPTVTFNENVRLVNDEAITNTNAATVVELRLNNATGGLVPFTTTFENNTITLIPTVALTNNQTYFVTLLPNMVEDFSNNAVTVVTGSTFTTIAVQTQFQAGDLVFVGYRMNATATEDEVALLTMVDIEPGTFINLTDSKYTTNAQPQCPNGIVWTLGANECVPAGSVITIQTSALIANKGTVTGSGFGLSSGGDQVIVYTGTAAAPNYITALSSNGWVASNTTCGGSISMIPAGLTDGSTALNTSTATGNVAANAVNAFYNGTQSGTPETLTTAILNPANWVAVEGGTAPQTWPTWNFPSTIQVLNAVVINNTTIEVTFNQSVNAASASTLSNYTGVANLTSAVVADNKVTLTYSTPFLPATDYALVVDNVQNVNNAPMSCPFTFTFGFDTSVSLASSFVKVNENAGTLNFVINLDSPAVASVDLVVKGAPFSTADANDFTLTTQTLNFTGTSSLTQTITIPITDDSTIEQQAEYFVLSLENPIGLTINGDSFATIYIIDNDNVAPVPSQEIELNYIGSFDPSGNNTSTCEIVAHDPISQRLFATSAIANFLDIIDFSDPTAPTLITSINMDTYGGLTSVAVKNGIVAVASPNANEALDGSVVFFDTNGVFQKQVTVGALPDMITFTPDGTKVLTANEGQPNANYSIDPEGSVSVIDISGGIPALTQSNVTTMLFTQFNSQETTLMASGVRKLKLTSTLSQDFEPEYITISDDSQTAWVSLQENNAIAAINLTNNTYTSVWALGTKDMSLPGNGFDASDNNSEILIANWPVKAFYLPDAMSSYTVGGVTYLVTANEGDEKEYTGFEERTTVGAASYQLDGTNFPHVEMLKKSHNLGRFRVTNLNGNLDGDAQFEEINCVGSRSFSIFNTATQQIVYDSGDDFERYTAENYPTIFNADHEENAAKVRSRAKGPEPEGVTVATIADQTFAFIGLERIGGVMVYNITDPNNPTFVDYKNTRSTSAYSGDHGAEGVIYIEPTNGPDDKGYVLVSNEISGTITIFEVDATTLSTPDHANTDPKTFVVFPNPSDRGMVYFNRTADIELYDGTGKLILQAKEAQTIDTSNLATGLYFVKTSEGLVSKIIIK